VIHDSGRSAPRETLRARLAGRSRRAAVLVALGLLVGVPASSGGLATSSSSQRASAAVASGIPPTPFGPPGWWHLVFADEFDAGLLDGMRWRTCFWWADTTCSIETNHELELYDPEDVSVGGGALHLRAQMRDMVGWDGSVRHYTAGMVMTGGRKDESAPGFTFTYGYAEARVKVPKGRGLWPAFWLLPASYESRPEIDAMEILGDSTNVQHMNFHYRKPDGGKGDAGLTWAGPDFSAGWHTFGVDWEPEAIVWYVDGVERWRFADTSVIPREPMYLLANLAVGGSWPGAPDAATPFPSSYDIDYIRVWQRTGGPPAATTLVPADATWRYLDNGSDQGTGWRAPAYDDSRWKSGAAILGYGQGNETTVVGHGPDPNGKYVTTYFRDTFTAPDPSALGRLTLTLRRDDGAVVYLNGSEVYRSNMPSGTITSQTLAYQASDDGNQTFSAGISPRLLHSGSNTIAVEVHQATRDSSDVTMQLSLTAAPTSR
jgi:beta-glucanase (GH16 family)